MTSVVDLVNVLDCCNAAYGHGSPQLSTVQTLQVTLLYGVIPSLFGTVTDRENAPSFPSLCLHLLTHQPDEAGLSLVAMPGVPDVTSATSVDHVSYQTVRRSVGVPLADITARVRQSGYSETLRWVCLCYCTWCNECAWTLALVQLLRCKLPETLVPFYLYPGTATYNRVDSASLSQTIAG